MTKQTTRFDVMLPLRLGAQNLLSKEMSSFTSMEKVTNLLQILLSTPTYGVVK